DLGVVIVLPVTSILQDNRRMRSIGRVAYKHAAAHKPINGCRAAIVSARLRGRSHDLGRETAGDPMVFDSVLLPFRIRPCQCQYELLAPASAPLAAAAFDDCDGFQAVGENVTGLGRVPKSANEHDRPQDGSQDEQPSNFCSKRSKHCPPPVQSSNRSSAPCSAPRASPAGSSVQYDRHLLSAAPDGDAPDPGLLRGRALEVAGLGDLLVIDRKYDVALAEAEALRRRAAG